MTLFVLENETLNTVCYQKSLLMSASLHRAYTQK